MMRAAAYAEFGHLGLAVDDYAEAIGLDSQNAAAFLGRADTYRRWGSFQRTIRAPCSAARGSRARRRWRTTRVC